MRKRGVDLVVDMDGDIVGRDIEVEVFIPWVVGLEEIVLS